AGMTGTASTSAEEFAKVYEIDVMEIPTNKPLVRKDLSDIVYKTEKGKFDAIVEKIKEINATGQPVLVGTIAIEKSEYLSALLTRFGIEHDVLNAKQHEKEANIIVSAGQRGAVTIATNMAGRGTDIKLGEGVKEVGGLFILGTERHEARRIDNQLRGRAGRQGDPGASQFYVSLEDELMRRFGGDKLKNMMDTLGLPEDQPIQNGIISRTIENAQQKIEGFNFDTRKHVLDYDDVMNKQREVVYKKRKEILLMKDAKSEMLNYITDEIERMVGFHGAGEEGEWDIDGLFEGIKNFFPVDNAVKNKLEVIKNDNARNQAEKNGDMTEYLTGIAKEVYNRKEQEIGTDMMRNIERAIILQTIDAKWMDHLDEIDYFREGVGLRGYGQRDPLIEYKREAYLMFSHLMDSIHSAIVHTIFRISPMPQAAISQHTPETVSANLNYSGGGEVQQFSAYANASADKGAQEREIGDKKEEKKQEPILNKNKVGRNDPCPCGSGKKYKRCCGA
ncbi:MAG: SEC-C metal-binding domain-containing protein, partial [Candidatus Pacebacteria bacterium]|nr:SEC-C metal-binding domain-containing protein [Candidatus Paceibacterota bacterium]